MLKLMVGLHWSANNQSVNVFNSLLILDHMPVKIITINKYWTWHVRYFKIKINMISHK